MEVCVVPEREELPKERSYGEGGVGILSFHMEGDDEGSLSHNCSPHCIV